MPTTARQPVEYEQDYYAWLTENAVLVREGRMGAIDLAHLADELEDMGRSERRAIERYLKALIVHLLKWQHQPERRGVSWELPIANARDAIARRLQESPSLRPKLPEMIAARYPNARHHTALETGIPLVELPDICPFTVEQLLEQSYCGE